MIILDTNVLSELMKPEPAASVMAWADQLSAEAVAITAMNEAEILHGIARLPDSQRKQQFQRSWSSLVAEVLQLPVLPFNSAAAHWYAALVSHRERMARPISTADAVLAATALAPDGPRATRSPADVGAVGLRLITPWASAGTS